MCGICGKLYFDRQRPARPDLVTAMMDQIKHRGPDGAGHYVAGPVALGHRRLSIIDLSTGDQPMSNEDGTVWVVFNGEIYNFKTLRAELLQRGHQFRSVSDTEVIVHMYEEYGDECVRHLQGMFSFALWDQNRHHLLLARDRVGIKPLYYTHDQHGISFASEIKSLLIDSERQHSLNLAAIDTFLTYYFLPGEQTLHQGIFKLLPGHYLTVDGEHVEIRQYWDLKFPEKALDLSFEAAVQQLKELLSQSVRDHMVSDVPVGVLLSGGVDSTAMLSLASRHADRPLHTFTMGFDNGPFSDERPYARMAARQYGSIHHEMTMNSNDFREFLPRYVRHMEEPVCEPPAIALYYVTQLARQSSVKVLLSGEGGDEAFGGYQEYRNLQFLERLKDSFGPFNVVLKRGFQLLSRAGWKRGDHYAALTNQALADYYLSRTATPNSPFNQLKPSLYGREISDAALRATQIPTRHLWGQVSDQPALHQMLYVDTKSWLPDDLLVKADKMTMAASVELRVPLLDARVLEFAAALPHQYKVRRTQLKRILKAALASNVPDAILNRKKTGFPVPYAQWLRKDLGDFVSDTLLASHSLCTQYFNKQDVAGLLKANADGAPYSKEVFSLLVLELWHQEFGTTRVEPPSSPCPASTGLAEATT